MNTIDLKKIYGDLSKDVNLDVHEVSSKLKKAAILTPAVAAFAVTDAIADPVCYDGAPIVVSSSSYGLDLNGDGLIDFYLNHTSSGGAFLNLNTVATTGGGTLTNLFLVSAGPGVYYSAANLSAGYSVNTGIPSSTCLVNVGSGPGPVHFNSGCATLSYGIYGNFLAPDQDGYLGVTFFDAMGNQHTGWIEIEIGPGGVITILNYGYEDVAGASILTGECPTVVGVPTMSQWGIGILGLLAVAFGSAFTFMRRRLSLSVQKS